MPQERPAQSDLLLQQFWSLTPQACETCVEVAGANILFTQSCQVLWRGMQEGARVSGPASAKLKRFAAALKLDDKHHTALVQSAAAHNMEVGNFGCVCMLLFVCHAWCLCHFVQSKCNTLACLEVDICKDACKPPMNMQLHQPRLLQPCWTLFRFVSILLKHPQNIETRSCCPQIVLS